LSAEGKQKGQKGQEEAKRLFLPPLALFAFLASPIVFQKTNHRWDYGA
jgi:hypothetical protein